LCSGEAYRHRSKLEVLLGPGIWRELADKTVLDFGCGTGDDTIEIATRRKR
jgi:ubiquinone/menaquinone biosynthesis C-methylase UbiE